MIERGKPRTNIECAEICGTIRGLLRDDIGEYDTMGVWAAVGMGGGASEGPPPEKNVRW